MIASKSLVRGRKATPVQLVFLFVLLLAIVAKSASSVNGATSIAENVVLICLNNNNR